MLKSSKSKVIVFCKAPIAGKVKTRLIPQFGKRRAAYISRQLLIHTLHSINVSQLINDGHTVELCCAPNCNFPIFRQLARQYGIRSQVQIGAGLGSRMSHAIRAGLKSYSSVILIGSDCPEYSCEYIQQAIAKSGVVLGPALDGGYVLIGATLSDSRLFSAIPFGTNQVVKKTLAAVRCSGINISFLSELRDLDRADDYRYFIKNRNIKC